MPELAVTINGRSYSVSCGEGEEERIRGLAQYVDAKVADFARTLGQIGDAKLLVLASLLVCDELADATEELRRQRRAAAISQPAANGHSAALEGVMAAGIENLAARVEAIAARLETDHV
jgi:cell division protein ZapA